MVAPLTAVLPVAAAPVDPAFADVAVMSGFTNPTAIEFASDGRVFVAEKSGIIKVFDSLSDSTPTTFADLRTNVHNFWDRGLLGMALHPNFPTDPRVYVLYTYDAAIGGTAPRWGSVGGTGDGCPNPPGATADGCVVSGRLSVLNANGNVSSGETVLINDWCQQYPSHSVGDLRFGADGALYVTGGDGASFNFTDYGQDGSPVNPCGDPSNRADGQMLVPTAEGGALRSQDIRTTGDPVTLDGALLRLDPNTGAAMAGNPLVGNADANARRMVGYGFRNPFRFTVRPGTNEVWVADVGSGDWEEIDRIPNPTAPAPITNRGWPCIEGASFHPGSFGDLNLCQSLYTAGTATAPYYAYRHGTQVAGETCPTTSGSSISGIAFYEGGPYPAQYDGALFFADYSRNCIWVMRAGSNGLPDPATTAPFIQNAAAPVQLKVGPNGDLFYPDFTGGTIHRISYQAAGGTPVANASATPTSGTAPLTVQFSSSGSFDPDGGALTYAWDLDGDGQFDDSTAPNPAFTYTTPATVTAALRVTDPTSLSDTDQVTITVLGSGGTQYLSDLPFVSSTNGWGPVERDRSNGEMGATDGGVLTLNGVTYAKGLGVHADSDVRISIPTGCTAFAAVIGIDDEVGANGSVTFQVFGDSTNLLTSGALTGAAAGQPISVDLTGRSQLRLVVSAGASPDHDHADWADARLTCSSGGGNAPPVPTIVSPAASDTWHVGETFPFSGSATDAEDGPLPASALDWDLLLHHCDVGCHVHDIQSWDDVASGSFDAPDHEYPAHLELVLTATDSGGRTATTSVSLDPETVDLTFATAPSGLEVTVGNATDTAPFTRTVIVGSKTTITTASPQVLGGTSYEFSSWSDGGAQNHDIVAGTAPTTYTATFAAQGGATTRYVSDLPFISSTNGWGPVERDRSNGETGATDGGAITLNGATYAKGLGVHANSDVRVAIPAGCTAFNAVIGVDDEVGAAGSVTFQVLGGTTSLFTSGVLTGAQAGQPISASLGSATELRLVVSGGADVNSDHADWADARLTCSTGPNTAPVLTPPANQSGTDGAAASLQLQATDADADILSYGASGLPPGLNVNTSTGLISGTIGSGASAGSPYTVTATVNDGRGGTDSETFTWTVTAPPAPGSPPGLTATPTTEDTHLAWGVSAGSVAGYNVYRAASAAGPFTKLTASPLTVRTYTDTTAPPLATSWYRVTAVGPTGLESAPASVSADRRIQLVNLTSAINTGTATIQIPVPTGRQTNDVLLATVTVAGGQTVTAPAGWTSIRSDASGSALRQAAFYRVITASEPASYTFSLSGARYAAGAMVLYRGVDTTTPVEAHSGRVTGSGTQVLTTPVTTITPNAAVVGVFGAAWNTTITAPSTMRDQVVVSLNKSQQRLAFRIADRVQPTPGGTGTLTAVLGRSAASIGQLYVLRPASP